MRRARILADAFNFRDLGGIPTSDGRVTRRGRVFRSNCLVGIGPADLETLRTDLRIATLIDLRGPAEAAREEPSPLDGWGLRCERLPLLDERVAQPGVISDLLSRYEGYLSGAGASVVRALEIIADEGSHPVVFHCSVGKDRTGVLAAILLGCLGVPADVIAGDYSASGDDRARLVRFLRGRPGFEETAEDDPILATDPAVMTALLNGLEERHGGAAGWALSAGLDQATLDRLRAVLLEEPDR